MDEVFEDIIAAKIYIDGSGHHIAIRPTHNTSVKRTDRPEELIKVEIHDNEIKNDVVKIDNNEDENNKKVVNKSINKKNHTVSMTKKQLFNKLYEECRTLKRKEQYSYIFERMQGYFVNENDAKEFIETNFYRVARNIAVRRLRVERKAYSNPFNYFCTFTYDGKKHTEESFRKKLSKTLRNFTARRSWKYLGVWERSPEKERLHFHAILYVPEGQMVGELKTVKDYDTSNNRMQTVTLNTFFSEKFGRTTFEEITHTALKTQALNYILKYLSKSGEKIISSRGVKQFFISDIQREDILARYADQENKFILSPKFLCITDGGILGEVSEKIIAQLPKAN